MTRKQWLETFLHLADSGAAAIDYRKRLRLKTNVLGIHIAKLGSYREELAAIIKQEEDMSVKALMAIPKTISTPRLEEDSLVDLAQAEREAERGLQAEEETERGLWEFDRD